MLITFKSKNSGEVFMLDKHALAVLKVAGRDYGEQLPAEGVFTAEQLSDAIANLRQAVVEDDIKICIVTLFTKNKRKSAKKKSLKRRIQC